MVVRIMFDRVYDKKADDPKRVVVKKVEGVINKEKLPADYIRDGPRFYVYDDYLYVFDENGRLIVDVCYREPFELSWRSFKRMVDVMRKAGDRLHEINKRHRVESELWEEHDLFIEI